MLFLSYSHKDSTFVNRLASKLVQSRVHIWMDKLEIRVGDTLLEKIQKAVRTSGQLGIILSKSSVRSKWCREEVNAGLTRQLKSRKVIILPILIEECTIPPFLASRKYADFTKGFDIGFDELLKSLEATSETNSGRRKSPKFHTDYALHWGLHDGLLLIEIVAVSFSEVDTFSVVTKTQIHCNKIATRRFAEYAKKSLSEAFVAVILGSFADLIDNNDAHVSHSDGNPLMLPIGLKDDQLGMKSELLMEIRRLGEPTGNPLIFHFGSIIGGVFRDLAANRKSLSERELANLTAILETPV